MADIFDFYVYDDRSIRFAIAEPIMLEDKDVTQFRFRIPKSLNGFDMSGWAWWFVYVNAEGTKYSLPMTLNDDEDDPDNYALSTVTINYGMSGKAGTIKFAIEVIDADGQGDILHEWHTKTYSTNVESTLQGNQVEYSETESDVISALLQRVQELISLGGGSPLVANTASAMTDTTKVYLYTGNETGYTFGDWYYYNGSAWTDGGAYGSGSGGGLTFEEKQLILTLFGKAAYADDDASEAYEELSSLWQGYSVAWSGSGYTKSNNATSVQSGTTFTSTVTANIGYSISSVTATMGGVTVQGAWNNGTVTIPNVSGDIVITVTTAAASVSSISAVYTQSGTVYDTDSLDSLKADLVVTATFSDSSTGTVASADYTLSGTLTAGTSTVTVSFGGQTTTFTVTVTANPNVLKYSFDFTQSLTDSVDGNTATLNGSAERTSAGVTLKSASDYVSFASPLCDSSGNVLIEIDIASVSKAYSSGHGRLVMWNPAGTMGLIYRNTGRWEVYQSSWLTPTDKITDVTYIAGKTVKIDISEPSTGSYPTASASVYIGDMTINENFTVKMYSGATDGATSMTLGSSGGNTFYNVTISAVRVYERSE